jgi:Tfp pilus assembly protein PilF
LLTDGPDARATAERSLELALAAGLVGDTLRAYANLVWAAIRHRAHPLADRYLRAATEYASDPELDLWRIYLLGYRARSELDQGRWDDAATPTRGRRSTRRSRSRVPSSSGLNRSLWRAPRRRG